MAVRLRPIGPAIATCMQLQHVCMLPREASRELCYQLAGSGGPWCTRSPSAHLVRSPYYLSAEGQSSLRAAVVAGYRLDTIEAGFSPTSQPPAVPLFRALGSALIIHCWRSRSTRVAKVKVAPRMAAAARGGGGARRRRGGGQRAERRAVAVAHHHLDTAARARV